MAGVNTTRDYATRMGFGYYDPEAGLVKVTHPLLQGGIVSKPSMANGFSTTLIVNQVAVYYLPGTLVGALWGGWLGDRYGRIATVGFGAVWTIIGAVLQTSATNANFMFCGML